MTYEERKKWLCEQCHQKTDCAYVNRNMEYKCLLVEERMEGWELGYKDAVKDACELLMRMVWEVTYEDIECNSTQHYDKIEFIEDFKKAMEEQQ